MPFIVPFLPLILGGVSAGLGALGSTQDRTATSGSQSESESAGLFRGRQKNVFKALGKTLLEQLQMGPVVPQWQRDQARTQINDTHDAIRPRLESALTSRGFGESGKLGAGFKGLEIARSKEFMDTEADLRGEALNRWMGMLDLAQNYIKPMKFQTSSTQTGSATQPGQSGFSAAGGGLAEFLGLLDLFNSGSKGPSLPSGFGQQVGGAVGAGGGFGFPCAIARELYGDGNWRVPVVRGWLLSQARVSRRWAVGVIAYAVAGRVVAKTLRRARFLRPPFQRLFDGMLLKAMNA